MSEDRNGDLIADGSPQKKIELPTGGEHDAHAIRRGPDGWWYLMVGNFAQGIGSIQTDTDAPVINPRAGTLWRISPDFSKRGCWAHGFRNAYDFDFLSNGLVVTYDSDEEREVTLPWYRPTRVLVVGPGNDGGWLDSAWFDLDQRVTMPQTITRLGRGSPTGVATYRHQAYPRKYFDAAFVLDWTFGRVMAIYPQPSDAKEATDNKALRPSRFMAETFMQATGTEGFAPTDICIDREGAVIVCVGGRGTAGALFRVRYQPAGSFIQPRPIHERMEVVESLEDGSNGVNAIDPTLSQELLAALNAASPLDSWSRNKVQQSLAKLPPSALENFCSGRWRLRAIPTQDGNTETIPPHPDASFAVESSLEKLEPRWRRLAAQMILNRNESLSIATVQKMIEDRSPTVQSAGWWVLGHSQLDLSTDQTRKLLANVLPSETSSTAAATDATDDLSDLDRLLGYIPLRFQYEAIGLRRLPTPELPENAFTTTDWQSKNALRQMKLWASFREVEKSKQPASGFDAVAGKLLFGKVQPTIDRSAMDVLTKKIAASPSIDDPQSLIEWMTILQSSLGDWRHTVPLQNAPSQVHATDGYRSWFIASLPDVSRTGWVKWCLSIIDRHSVNAESKQQPKSPLSTIIVAEAMRTMAMLEPKSSDAIDICLAHITDESHPTWDIHTLVSLACCQGKRNELQSRATARALPLILKKVESLGSTPIADGRHD